MAMHVYTVRALIGANNKWTKNEPFAACLLGSKLANINTHSDESLCDAFEDGYNCYTSMGDRYSDEPSDPVLSAAFQAGYESAQDRA